MTKYTRENVKKEREIRRKSDIHVQNSFEHVSGCHMLGNQADTCPSNIDSWLSLFCILNLCQK